MLKWNKVDKKGKPMVKGHSGFEPHDYVSDKGDFKIINNSFFERQNAWVLTQHGNNVASFNTLKEAKARAEARYINSMSFGGVAENEQFAQIEGELYKLATTGRNIELIGNYVIGTDTVLRSNKLGDFSKEKLQRFLEYIDKNVIQDLEKLDLKIYDERQYRYRMFVHAAIVYTIIDIAEQKGWRISRNWIIQ